MARRLMIQGLPQAHEIIKEMDLSTEWELDYRQAARGTLARILGERMQDWVGRHFEEIERLGESDRRNGSYARHLLTELGDIELQIPRTRGMSAVQMILAYFVLGLSTRKVAQALLPVLGERVSASTVSAVASFHRRPLKKIYRFLILDGVVLKRKTGAGSVKRVVLVALGITPQGKKEVIDFFIALGESQEAWEAFLHDLYSRGLDDETLEMIITDGGKGLLAAMPLIYPRIPPLQRCWAHKTPNVLNFVRQTDRIAVKAALHKISHTSGIGQAQKAIGNFTKTWSLKYPKAVASLLAHEKQLLAFFTIKNPSLWS